MTPTRKIGIGAFLLGSVVGGAIGMNGLASAASNATTPATTVVDSSSTTSGTDTSATDTSGTDTSGTDTSGTGTSGTGTSGTDDANPQPPGPHTANGITEVVLTGDTATSVQAAVLAAHPDATIERMETDAEGAVYEAHITLADGSSATVKLDASFTVTGTETGGPGGPGGHHGGGPGRPHDNDADDTTSAASTTP